MNSKYTINFWYWVILLSLISSIFWFFIDVNKSQNTDKLITKSTQYTKELENNFNQHAITVLETKTKIKNDKLDKYNKQIIIKENKVFHHTL